MSETEHRETAGATRSQNVLYVRPYEAAAIAQIIAPLIERASREAPEGQLLIIAPDAESAMAIAGTAPEGRVVPVTSLRRAARLLGSRAPHAIVGPPEELLALVKASVLRPGSARTVVLAWLDDILASGGGEALGILMAEVPRDGAKVIIAAELDERVEQYVERYARRARRVAEGVPDDLGPVDIRYVSVAAAARPSALRRLLDDLDPAGATIYVRTDAGERDVRQMLAMLGYGVEDAVAVSRGGEAAAGPLLVLYDLPASAVELRALRGGKALDVVSLAQPRQVRALRALALGGRVRPLTFPEAARDARARERSLLAELREVLHGGTPSRELLSLEPLLEEFDGVEIAAAALRLLERARERASATTDAATGATAAGAPVPWTRVYLNVGTKDGARPADVVGAIAGEAGLAREQIGRVELRENHALVDIAPDVAARVASQLTGKSIRGRRVMARVDEERPGRGGARGVDRTGRGGDRAPRGDRAGGPAGAPRGSRPPRAGDRDRDRDPAGRAGGDRGPSRSRGAVGGPHDRGRA